MPCCSPVAPAVVLDFLDGHRERVGEEHGTESVVTVLKDLQHEIDRLVITESIACFHPAGRVRAVVRSLPTGRRRRISRDRCRARPMPS